MSAGPALGISPLAEAAAGGGSRVIGWRVAPSDVGDVVVAATAKGVCAVRFGAPASKLLGEIRHEHPDAELVEDPGLDPTAAYIAALAGSQHDDVDAGSLPLDMGGTAFQTRVWDVLRAVPSGTTTTYKEIAEAIGRPDACRAVGGAIAANPIGIVVPCHRVIRSDGHLGGYRWGTGAKSHLLEVEGAPQPVP